MSVVYFSRSVFKLNLITVTFLVNCMAYAETTMNATHQLPEITVIAEQNGSAEEGYLVKNTKGVGIWSEKSLQDTPYSMSIISGDLIENVVAKDLDQIFKMNPTTQEEAKIASEATDSEWVTIRGFNVSNPIINGIPSTSRVAGTPMMQDLERVEIINGATGFLYGGGRVGGAVNYVTKKPTLDTQGSVSAGSYGGSSYFAHADLSGQIDKNNIFGYRISAMYQDGETARKETKEQTAVSLMIDYKPFDGFVTDLKYSFKDTTSPVANIFWTARDGAHYRKNISKNQSFTPEWHTQYFTSHKLENTTKWNINDIFTLRTNFSYEDIEKTGADSRMVFDANGMVQGKYVTGGNTRNGSWLGAPSYSELEKKGANIYFDSKFDTFGIGHNLTLGYGFSSEQNNNVNSLLRTLSSYYIDNDMTPEEFRQIAKPLAWANGVDKSPITKASLTEYSNILIGDDIQWNDQWSSLIGVNYANTMTYNYRAAATVKPKYDASAWTPTVSLIYKPVENLSTYATYIESLEAGSVVGNTYDNEGDVLDAYKSKQFELGSKWTINNRLMINSALFRIEKANQFVIERTFPKKNILTQDGSQIHQGVELGITGKATDNLTLMAGGTWMDLSIDKATDKSTEGKKPTGAASKMAKIYAEYKLPILEGLSISGGAYYTGEKYIDAQNLYVVPAYTLFDAGVRYSTKLAQYPTTFNFNLQNITDKVYWSGSRSLGDPRTFAFSVKMKF